MQIARSKILGQLNYYLRCSVDQKMAVKRSDAEKSLVKWEKNKLPVPLNIDVINHYCY